MKFRSVFAAHMRVYRFSISVEVTPVSRFLRLFVLLQMPVLDGLQATRKIRESEKKHNYPHKPIIGLTAHAIQGYKDKCLSAGMDAYACKPFQARELIQVIQAVCKMWSVRPSKAEVMPTTAVVGKLDDTSGDHT